MTRILVLGAGGIGGYFGGRLVQAGRDVTFLVRKARAARLQADGLVIRSPLGDAALQVRTTTADALDGRYDLFLLSCKAYDLDEAIEAIRPAVGEHTSIVPLLNGLAHLDRLDRAFSPACVLGGTAHISATLSRDGAIRHMGKLDGLTFGDRGDDTGGRARCDRVASVLAGAPFTVKRSEQIMQDMWEKFVFITAAAAITCLMRAPVGAILEAVQGEEHILRMLAECEAVAAGAGYPVREKAKLWARNLLTERGSAFTTSMLRDVENGAKVEAEHLQGDMIARADVLGVDVGLLRVAYAHLKSYEARRAADRARS